MFSLGCDTCLYRPKEKNVLVCDLGRLTTRSGTLSLNHAKNFDCPFCCCGLVANRHLSVSFGGWLLSHENVGAAAAGCIDSGFDGELALGSGHHHGPLQVLLTTALPSFAWLAFVHFSGPQPKRKPWILIHIIPVLLCCLALAFAQDAIDLIIIGTFVTYGLAFMRLALSDESQFQTTALGGLFDLRRALWLIVFTLFGSAVIDTLVFLDFAKNGGSHATTLIGIGNMIWLLLLGVSTVLGGKAAPDEDEAEPEVTQVDPAEYQKIVVRVNDLLTQGGLAREPSLTLSRLARRAGLPARQVSQAIIRVHGQNVSQFVNDVRVAEACRLLRETDRSITAIIYDSGFQTKSNFNREFLRVAGKTPREWRNEKGQSN